MPFHDRSITGRLEKGWKVVTCIPAKLIHPHASEHDMVTIFSRYTPYPKDENELPDAPPVKVDLLDTKLEKFDIDEVLEASTDEEECITCEGSGMEPHSHDACPDCEGTGEEGEPIKDMTILELAQMLEDGIMNSGLLDGNMSVREYLKNYL
jgi:hypothetical protein